METIPRRLAVEEYFHGILVGDRSILARAITLVESDRPSDAELAQRLLDRCLPGVRDTIRVGVTGVPGAGKSTFIETLGTYLTVQRGEKVAVLAVDPSSPVSGGSILGDKTRMPKLSSNPLAFIRPSPSRGSLGGVTRQTREAMVLCEAAGFSNVLVETMGVGQSETAVASMVDFFLLLMLPGGGDELQGIKRGILELADLVAVSKCDGDNRAACDIARQQLAGALQLFPPAPSGWTRRVITCSSLDGENIEGIWELVSDYRSHAYATGFFATKRREQARAWMYESIEHKLRETFFADPAVRSQLPATERAVLEGRLSAARAAEALLRRYNRGGD